MKRKMEANRAGTGGSSASRSEPPPRPAHNVTDDQLAPSAADRQTAQDLIKILRKRGHSIDSMLLVVENPMACYCAGIRTAVREILGKQPQSDGASDPVNAEREVVAGAVITATDQGAGPPGRRKSHSSDSGVRQRARR